MLNLEGQPELTLEMIDGTTDSSKKFFLADEPELCDNPTGSGTSVAPRWGDLFCYFVAAFRVVVSGRLALEDLS